MGLARRLRRGSVKIESDSITGFRLKRKKTCGRNRKLTKSRRKTNSQNQKYTYL